MKKMTEVAVKLRLTVVAVVERKIRMAVLEKLTGVAL